MAVRPVFVVSLDQTFCARRNIEFKYFSGFSDTQQKKNIKSLHQAFALEHGDVKILEISTKSEEELGVRLSAFNLMIRTNGGREFSVESAFQASKVFEGGGPYKDLLGVPSRVAKRDERLRNSGKIIAFSIGGHRFPTEPKTYFYNWMYINALHTHPDLAERLLEYGAFTDIAFNPQKSINCQAEAVAIYVSLQKQDLLGEALKDKEAFLDVVYPDFKEAGEEDDEVFGDEEADDRR